MILEPLHRASANAEQLNADCRCTSLNHRALRAELARFDDGENDLYRMVTADRPHLFAESAVFLNRDCLDRQLRIITAVEQVIANPAYQQQVLSYAPDTAQLPVKTHGVFQGYDFHLSPDGPKLIEINSNAGGAMVNAVLVRAQNSCCEIVNYRQPGRIDCLAGGNRETERLFIAMFYKEWQAERELAPLRSIAIVDEDPKNQYMWPEFLLYKHLFEQQGLKTLICDPAELRFERGGLWHGEQQIDLVYNRLTDFGLETEKCLPLREAYLANAVVLTPHPRNHALYADKRNLTWLGNEAFLASIGIDSANRESLRTGIAHTILVNADDADRLWANRKQLFFKPAKGYGSKAAYRGDKLTRRVFEEILQHDYVAQTLVPPSERHLDAGELKLDLRHFTYQGRTQLICARLYQGQTTNFRTPGGGFAQVVVVD